ncbi:MAG: choice-of-anchor D domain-containing protein, partial [bacterium]
CNDYFDKELTVSLRGAGIPPEPDISIPAISHDFDGVYLGNAATWTIPISNVGSAPLTVDSIVSDTEQFEITFPSFPHTLNPAGGIDVIVSFRPTALDSLRGALTVFSDDPDEATVLVAVTGRGLEPATLAVLGGGGNPGTVANPVPIGLDNQWGIASVEFVLSFPESVLTATAAIPTERSQHMALFQVDLEYGLGKVKLSISDQAQSIPAGSGSVAKFAFNVAEEALSGDYPLTLSEVTSFDAQGREVSFVLGDSIFSIRPVGVEDREDHGDGPLTYALFQNHPNPFNPTTTIRYAIPSREYALATTLKIYNILGQEVKTLVDEVEEPGYYTVMWDGTDGLGQEVPSGIYLCRLEAVNFVSTKKMILAR